MLINLKTNKYMIIKELKKKRKRRIPLYLGKWECLNMLHNQRAYKATTNMIAFVEKILTIHVGGCLQFAAIFIHCSHIIEISLYIVNNETQRKVKQEKKEKEEGRVELLRE